MAIICDVLLKERNYKPITGYYGEPKYTLIFYDEEYHKDKLRIEHYSFGGIVRIKNKRVC